MKEFFLENLYYYKILGVILAFALAYVLYRIYKKKHPLDPALRALEVAGNLFEHGKKDKAMKVIQDVLNKHPKNKKVYATAFNIYWINDMYPEAKAMFGVYKNEFGEELKVDRTFEQLEQEEKISKKQVDSSKGEDGVWVFKARMFWAKVVIDFGLPSIIKEVRVSPEGLSIKYLYNERHYAWSEVKESWSVLINGEGSDVRWAVIKFADKQIELNELSFKNGRVLVDQALPEYIKLPRRKYKEFGWVGLVMGFICLSLLGFFKTTGNWWYFGVAAGAFSGYLIFEKKKNRL
jgi:hypothetical protein